MQIPSSAEDFANIDWTCASMRHVTLGDIRNWATVAAQRHVVQPKPDEEAWEGTEIDVRRTVL